MKKPMRNASLLLVGGGIIFAAMSSYSIYIAQPELLNLAWKIYGSCAGAAAVLLLSCAIKLEQQLEARVKPWARPQVTEPASGAGCEWDWTSAVETKKLPPVVKD